MNSKVLADLVVEVIKSGKCQELTADQKLKFHSEFQEEIAESVEEMRAEKRRAYEELKSIAIR